jgi:phage terminase large subunit
MKNDSALSGKQKETFKRIVKDPVLFASHVLGANLWEKEVEILRSIDKNRRTAVKACHGVGKTFILAVAVLWWLARYPKGVVLTTSSTQRQVRTQLWSEIHKAAAQAKIPYPPLKTAELKLRDNNNFAIGFSTDRAENFQGYHGRRVLIIADEAPGIEYGIFEAMAGIMAGGTVHIVMAGNPTVPSGPFFDAFSRERGLWNCITIDAFDSPNLKGLTLDKLLQLDPSEGGPLDKNPVPYLATRRWVFEQYQDWWHGDEGSSPSWISRVRAQFPDQAHNALIKLSWLERAKERAIATPVKDATIRRLVAGVDVGGGEAETVVYVCEYRRGGCKIVDLGAWRGEDTRGHVIRFMDKYRQHLSEVRVDSIGIGHNFGLHLRDHGYAVKLINVGMSCDNKPEMGENNPAQRFVNSKALYYQTLADLFERNEIEGLTDETTIGQLASLLYEVDSQGRIRIESKEKARVRGVGSPDRAEALMLALGKPFERLLPEFMLRDLAVDEHKKGKSVEAIADYLETDDNEVQAWLHGAAAFQSSYDPFAKTCTYCNAAIPTGTPYQRERHRYYHVDCFRKFSFGS